MDSGPAMKAELQVAERDTVAGAVEGERQEAWGGRSELETELVGAGLALRQMTRFLQANRLTNGTTCRAGGPSQP